MKEKIELGQIFCGEYSENCEVDRMSCPFSDCMAEVWAEKILSLGYHKTVWHKVADGDLPEYAGLYLVVCGDKSLPEYDVDFYENHKDGKRWVHNEGRVIAWTEPPTYEGKIR